MYGYAIYTVLYRYSYGYSRSTYALSYGQIAKELKISSKRQSWCWRIRISWSHRGALPTIQKASSQGLQG